MRFFRSAMGPDFVTSMDDHGANAPPAGSGWRSLFLGHVTASETTLTLAGLVDALAVPGDGVGDVGLLRPAADAGRDDGVRRDRALHVRHQLGGRDAAPRLAGAAGVRGLRAPAPALAARRGAAGVRNDAARASRRWVCSVSPRRRPAGWSAQALQRRRPTPARAPGRAPARRCACSRPRRRRSLSPFLDHGRALRLRRLERMVDAHHALQPGPGASTRSTCAMLVAGVDHNGHALLRERLAHLRPGGDRGRRAGRAGGAAPPAGGGDAARPAAAARVAAPRQLPRPLRLPAGAAGRAPGVCSPPRPRCW